MKKISLKGPHLLVACVLAMLGLHTSLVAQQVTVRGRVVNETQEPVAGAKVGVQGTAIQTVTDAQGEFTLRAPNPTATLVVTRVGFGNAVVPLNGRTDVVVSLKGVAVQLDELVVVGYGTQKKSDVTGSVASVSAQRLENSPATNVTQAIQGVVPGVSVTTTGAGAEGRTNLVIRGQNSITANNNPLIVIDGIPYEGSLSELNQNDIASIEILKDASASAIYGARGSNGVILVTSKKGGGGAARFSYEGQTGIQEVANLPRLMTGPEFADFKCQRLRGGTNCEAALTASELENLNAGRFADWLGLATRTGHQQQHNLSFSGGSEGTKYYIAGSLLDVSGIARNDEFQRYTLRLNLAQDVRSWLEMGTNTQLSYADRSGLPADFEDAFFMNPLTSPYRGDGSLTTTPWPEDTFWGNPLQGLLVADNDVTRRVFTSNYLQVNAPFLEGLSLRINGGIDYANTDEGRYYGRDTRIGETTQGRAIRGHVTRFDWTVENLLHFRRDFGKHGLNLTGLYSVQGNNLEADSLRSQGFPNDVLTYYQANVGALVTPIYAYSDSHLLSQMGRANYSYDDRYLATFTVRRDGFSGFGANNKYGVFPSLALGWNISNESYWPSTESFNLLKLRASYGKNGNQAIRPYQTLARLDDFSYLDADQSAPGFYPVSLGNPNLKWETTTSLNVGLDFGFLRNRVTGSLDAYSARTEDLLLNRLISPVHGITRILQNIGEVENRGIEFQLSSVNLERGNFSWSTNFNIAANRNKIVDLYGDQTDDLINQWFIGRPIRVNYEYAFDGIWQEGDDIKNSAQPTAKPGDVRIRDVNGDGKITPADRTFLGSLEPDYTAGLTNTLRYKGFTLSALLQTVQGVTRENGLLGTNLVHNDVRRNTVYRQYWTPQNPINTYPANSNTSNPLGVGFFEDASFIRLKDATLSFDIPVSLSSRLGTESLRLYLSGRNLWTHTEWTGMDPELSNANQRGIPLERVIVGGVNVRF